VQVCTSLQTDNHTSTSPLSFFTGRMPFLPPNQQRQSTEGTNDCSLIKRKTSMILKEYALRLHHLSSSCPSNQGGSQDQISVIINVLFLNDSAFIVLQIKGWYRH